MSVESLISNQIVAGSDFDLTITLESGVSFEDGSTVTFFAASDLDTVTPVEIEKTVASEDLSLTQAIVRFVAADTSEIEIPATGQLRFNFEISVTTPANRKEYLKLSNGLSRGQFTLVKPLK